MDFEGHLGMLKEVRSIFKDEKINFWLEAGTLLGAIREKRILPWDTDIDLGAFKEDFPERSQKRLTKIFSRKGYIIHFYPEKIDIFKDGGKLSVQIHLMKRLNKKFFTRRMADNREKAGKKLFQIYRLCNVSYYGGFKIKPTRLNLKTDLFKMVTLLPNGLREKMSTKAMLKLSKLKDAGIYYFDIPESYFSKLKKIDFYGTPFSVPANPDKYLQQQYGDWRTPPKDKSKPWVWHEHGDWKKIYNEKEMII